MTFQRSASANELLYHKAAGAFSDVVIQLVIEGEGRIELALLKDAVNKVSENIPGCRLKLHCRRWIADGQLPRIIELAAYPDFQNDLNRQMRSLKPFDPRNGLTTEIALAHEGRRSAIIFRALHTVMDGQGLQIWAKAIFQALRDEAIPLAHSTVTDDELIQSLNPRPRPDDPKIPSAIGPKSRSSDPESYQQFDYARRSIRANIPALIPKLAVACRDYLDQEGKDGALVMVPVDVRDDLPAEQPGLNTGNLSLPIFITIRPNDDWIEAASQLLKKIEAKAYLGKGPSDFAYKIFPDRTLAWILARFYRYQINKGRYLVSAIISHVGKQSLADYCSKDFAAKSMVFPPSPMPVCPLSLIITEYDGRLEICLGKSRALPTTAETMLNDLLEVAGLNNLPEAPKAVTLKALRPPLNARVRCKDILEEIDQAIQIRPDAIAIVDGTRTLSFGEFQTERDQLASLLLQKTGRSLVGERIVLVVNRSIESFLLVHACLALGAVFVPVDPQYGDERLSAIIHDCEPALIISESSLSAAGGFPLLTLSEIFGATPKVDRGMLPKSFDPDRGAYIIYTSGTTGKPKGVPISRNQLGHYLDSVIKSEISPYPHEALAWFTTLSFDISITPLYASLMTGLKILIIREESAPLAMEQLLKSPIATYALMTPAHLQILLSLGTRPSSTWRALAIGGEGWNWDLALKAKELFGESVTIFNMYGPTEVTVAVGIYALNFDQPELDGLPIASSPVEHAAIYLLDEQGRESSEGEIYLAGHALSDGYWKDEIKTKAAFVDNPFLPGTKMYRTGDKGLFQKGKLYCLGRIDDQVKINGYRVELDEIISVLQKIAGIREAVVLLDKSVSKPTLHAFFTADKGLSETMIKDEMKRFLPHFMIPSAFHHVREIPLTVNGKVDRKSLLTALPLASAVESDDDEFDLRKIWARHLSLPFEQFALTSNYFDLGGDSVTLLRILHEVDDRRFQGKCFAQLFSETKNFWNTPTLKQMMQMVDLVASHTDKKLIEGRSFPKN